MMRNRQSGQVLVSAALMLVLLLGFAGLGVDMGVMRYNRRLQQTAADGAAIAGASNLPPNSGWQAGALNAATENGFADNNSGAGCVGGAVGCVSVAVNNPPLTGPHASGVNSLSYVEVIVTKVQPTYFMKIFGVNSELISARAVATSYAGATNGTSQGCLYTLGPPSSSIEGVSIGGSATLNAPGCGIVDNGNFNSNGNKIDVIAGTFGVSGVLNQSGKAGGTVTCTVTTSSCPTYGTPAAGDPLASLAAPCTYTCPTVGATISISGSHGSNTCSTGCVFNSVTNTYTISPGTYTKISISGVASDKVVFSPGVYIFDGTATNFNNPDGLIIPGNATITGSGVTFYFTNNATVQITGTPSLNLSAPSTGTYAGMLMWQDKQDPNTGPSPSGPTLNGNSGTQYNGILYFPSDQLTFSGTSNTMSVGVVVTDSVALSGNPDVTFTGVAGVPGGLPPSFVQAAAILVE